jgi:hypothetical protein
MKSVKGQVWHQVLDQFFEQVEDLVSYQFHGQVRRQVYDQVERQVLFQVWFKVRRQVLDQIGKKRKPNHEISP